MSKIFNATDVVHNFSSQGEEIISLSITFPRMFLNDILKYELSLRESFTEKSLSFEKLVNDIQNNTFMPIAWKKKDINEYYKSDEIPNTFEPNWFDNRWLDARDSAIEQAAIFNNAGITQKFWIGLLEPFMWVTMNISGVRKEWDKFLEKYCPQYKISGKVYKSWEDSIIDEYNDIQKWQLENMEPLPLLHKLQYNENDEEIHMVVLAENIYDAMKWSTHELETRKIISDMKRDGKFLGNKKL